MNIEQKSNKNLFPTSIYTFSAEELNQIVDELQNIITTAGLTKDATDTTQVLQAMRLLLSGTFESLIGVYVPYGGDILPAGWLWCDGSALSRVDYSGLFARIGTKFGVGDGSTTFNIPDFTGGRFIEGDSSSGTYKDAGLPNIAGTIDGEIDSWHTGAFTFWKSQGNVGNSGEAILRGYYFNASDGECGTTKANNPTYSNKVYGKSDTVQPKSLTSRWIIRY